MKIARNLFLLVLWAAPACAAGQDTLGYSVEGRPIEAHRFGGGEQHVVIVGTIHGGYEWNSALLAWRFVDHLDSMGAALPAAVRVTVVPVANPDGLAAVLGDAGRFGADDAPPWPGLDDVGPDDPLGRARTNANGVDLNRNWGCDWQADARWRSFTASGGDSAFSEPETRALRDFLLRADPDLVVFLHSAGDGVFLAPCESDPGEAALALLHAWGEAAAYPTYEEFPFYEVNGNAVGWLLERGVPSFAVELESHTEVEWERNRRGFEAVVRWLSARQPARN